MCTATWILMDRGYELFFNRDELRVRGEAKRPAVTSIDGARCIYPEDADAGGSWIGVNEYGFCAALLNYYGNSTGDGEYISRGLLLTSLLSCKDRNAAAMKVRACDIPRYRYFSLLLFDPTGPPVMIRWCGSERGTEYIIDPKMPKTSSSYRTDEVVSSRKRLFAEHYGSADRETLLAFHRSHEPDRGPFSVCMHREDARTVSFSRIVATEEKVEFYYTPGSPCSEEASPAVAMELRRD
jgi:hypothetical protein